MEALLVHRDDVEVEICITDIDTTIRQLNVDLGDVTFVDDALDVTLEEYNDDNDVRQDDNSDYDIGEPIALNEDDE